MSPIAAKTYTTDVICLRTYDFGEADKILHLYSSEHGRISAIAKGVKKPKSKLAGACELLNLSEVQLSKGKNLDLLVQYQPRESFSGIRSDLFKLAYALLFAELVNLTAGEADSHLIYADFKNALHGLDQADEPHIVPLGMAFQMDLLQAEGYHPVLNACIFTDQPLDWDAPFYSFSAQLGGVTTSELKRRYQSEAAGTAETGGVRQEEWVNVSTTTLKLLQNPHHPGWTTAHFYKAQKFVRYYFQKVVEKNLNAYDLVLNLLEMSLAAAPPEPGLPEEPG
ncbi:DNA repair protein RecO [Vampirovibrio sp.]|uniref:DNA repair protein RecO n=1 Tax=Vampirovibrio sp. TaxID=2717857 RepID=UPI0035937A04